MDYISLIEMEVPSAFSSMTLPTPVKPPADGHRKPPDTLGIVLLASGVTPVATPPAMVTSPRAGLAAVDPYRQFPTMDILS